MTQKSIILSHSNKQKNKKYYVYIFLLFLMNGQMDEIINIWLQSIQWFSKLYKHISNSFNEVLNSAEAFQLDRDIISNKGKMDSLQNDFQKQIKSLSVIINQHLESYSKWQIKKEFKLVNGISVAFLKSSNYPQAIRSIVEWSQKINDIGKQLFQYSNSCYQPKFLENESKVLDDSDTEFQTVILQQLGEQTPQQTNNQIIVAQKIQNNFTDNDSKDIQPFLIIDGLDERPLLLFGQQFIEEIKLLKQTSMVALTQQEYQSDFYQPQQLLLRKKVKHVDRQLQSKIQNIITLSYEGQINKEIKLQKQQASNKCILHQLQLFYISGNDSPFKYYCNQCLKSQAIQKNEILCRKHSSAIKYLILDDSLLEREENQQAFLCELCIIQNKSIIASICKEHYWPIQYVCLEDSCIKKANMMFCSKCSHHQTHQNIKFTKQSLINKFQIKKQINIDSYQQLYISAKQKLQMRLINKIMSSFLSQTEQITCLFESYAVHSNTQIQLWTDFFMKHRDKQSLTVLNSVAHLNQRQVDEQKRIQYFEVVNDLFQEEITVFLEVMTCQLSKLQRRMLQIAHIDDESIEDHLNQKYRTIKNIQLKDFAVNQPQNFFRINKQYYKRIENLIISKESEEQLEIEVEANRKKSLSHFFNQQMKQILCRSIEDSQQANQMYSQLLVADWLNRERLQEQYQQHNDVITQLTTLCESIQDQHERDSKSYKLLNIFFNGDFINLKIIQIQYALERPENNYKYTVSAFDIFGIIAQSQHLQQFVLKGVKVTQFNHLIKHLRLINQRNVEEQSYTDQENSLSSQRWTEQIRKVQWLNRTKTLKVAIEAQILWFAGNQLMFELARDLEYVSNFICLLSSIKFTFHLKRPCDTQILTNILNIIQKMDTIKLSINSYIVLNNQQNSIFYFLIDRLKNFDNIDEIEFKDIEFSPKLMKQQLEIYENAFNILFSNNKTRMLSLVNCNNFPSIPEVPSLQSIVQCKITLWRSHQIRTQSLRSLKIVNENYQSKTTPASNIHNLQALYIDDPSWLENQSKFPYLKHLTFILPETQENSKMAKIQQKIDKLFKNVLPKLVCLVCFHLEDIAIGINCILQIPSQELMDIYLNRCGTIDGDTLQQIDKKWPFLTKLAISYFLFDVVKCGNGNILAGCRFQGLTKIKLDKELVNQNKREVRMLRRRGIDVIIN